MEDNTEERMIDNTNVAMHEFNKNNWRRQLPSRSRHLPDISLDRTTPCISADPSDTNLPPFGGRPGQTGE